MTPEGQRERARGGQASNRDRGRAESHIPSKKKTGRGLYHLIPVSRAYLIGIGLSEAPTICSTRSTAAFLVLKP